ICSSCCFLHSQRMATMTKQSSCGLTINSRWLSAHPVQCAFYTRTDPTASSLKEILGSCDARPHQQGPSYQGNTKRSGQPSSPRANSFHSHHRTERQHPTQIGATQCKQKQHECPAAADTKEAVT